MLPPGQSLTKSRVEKYNRKNTSIRSAAKAEVLEPLYLAVDRILTGGLLWNSSQKDFLVAVGETQEKDMDGEGEGEGDEEGDGGGGGGEGGGGAGAGAAAAPAVATDAEDGGGDEDGAGFG